ncbi:MAG: zeta toxin family protein [Clostridiales bacterium]|jgi:predicted kinase|nr:zeta toxin family protein [Clostridiales bacterium]
MNEEFNDYTDEFTADNVKTAIENNFETLIEDKIPAKHPRIVIFMGGLPGAGKTSAIKDKEGEYNSIVVVDVDRYRRYHPKANEILEIGKMPEVRAADRGYFANKTNKFARRVSRGLIKRLREAGYNVIIDGTLRNPRYAIRMARIFKKKGYASASVEIIGTDKHTALQGTKVRFAEDTEGREAEKATGKELTIFPREVGIGFLNSVVKTLPESISALHKSGEFERIRIVDRKNVVHYDSAKTPNLDPREILQKLLERRKKYGVLRFR